MRTATNAALLLPQGETPAEAQPVRILLVEDTHSDIVLARVALDNLHIPYDLRVIKSGSEALNHLRERAPEGLPDLIMLDLGLPHMDGFEILNELADAPAALRSVPIVIITGYEDFEYMQHTIGLMISAYLTKPFDADKLREALSHIPRRSVH